jgi:hypothetical protein
VVGTASIDLRLAYIEGANGDQLSRSLAQLYEARRRGNDDLPAGDVRALHNRVQAGRSALLLLRSQETAGIVDELARRVWGTSTGDSQHVETIALVRSLTAQLHHEL